MSPSHQPQWQIHYVSCRRARLYFPFNACKVYLMMSLVRLLLWAVLKVWYRCRRVTCEQTGCYQKNPEMLTADDIHILFPRNPSCMRRCSNTQTVADCHYLLKCQPAGLPGRLMNEAHTKQRYVCLPEKWEFQFQPRIISQTRFFTLHTFTKASPGWRCVTLSEVQSKTFDFHPQHSLPGQRGCQHVSGGVWIGWRLLPHGHPLLGHGWRGSGRHWSGRSYHGHFRWVTEESSSNTNWSQRLWVTPHSELVEESAVMLMEISWLSKAGSVSGLSFTKTLLTLINNLSLLILLTNTCEAPRRRTGQLWGLRLRS